MAYLYAGLGIALIIPLMALVQTLVSLGSLEGEAGFLRARRLQLLNQALLSLEQGLNQAMAAVCLLYTSPSPRDVEESRMPSSA